MYDVADSRVEIPLRSPDLIAVNTLGQFAEHPRVAALRGHEVSLYEKTGRLGGLIPLASLVKGTELETLPDLVRYLKTQIHTLGVKVELG